LTVESVLLTALSGYLWPW